MTYKIQPLYRLRTTSYKHFTVQYLILFTVTKKIQVADKNANELDLQFKYDSKMLDFRSKYR